MKTLTKTLCLTLAFLSPLCTLIAQPTAANLKIGTYDSRIVVMAYSRSELFTQKMMKLRMDFEKAKKENDSIALEEMDGKGLTYQHLLHQQVFSNGSVLNVMELVKDKLPDVAASAGVSLIVSQWELNYKDTGIETVDLTMEIAALFSPKGDIAKMAEEIRKTDPMPIEDLNVKHIAED